MLINARSETILENPSFRKAAITRRALIPAESYLRMAEGRGREEDPVLPLLREGRPPGLRRPVRVLAHPSLPEDDPGKWLLSCTVLTTTAHDTLGQIHDRSPVIIPPDLFADWLDPERPKRTTCRACSTAFRNPS
jgi:putative SOS response-associated peptidase YedK